MSFVVALTGGIASGKTTVANLFHDQFGIDLVDADVIARDVVEPETEGLKAITAHFGQAILHPDGSLNRTALRERIFAAPNEKAWLNQLLHPMIRQGMRNALTQTTSPYALLIVPLLVENQLQTMADRVLVVDVDEKYRLSAPWRAIRYLANKLRLSLLRKPHALSVWRLLMMCSKMTQKTRNFCLKSHYCTKSI